MGRGLPTDGNTIVTATMLDELALVGERAAEAARSAPWREGDWLVDLIGDGKLEGEAKAEAMRVTRREPADLTKIIAVCRAFPGDQRRPELTFDHHAAVMDLDDALRPAMLAQAMAKGWTARQTRREVLAARVASGDHIPVARDDPEDVEFVKLARLWNHSSNAAREMLAGSIEDTGLASIVL